MQNPTAIESIRAFARECRLELPIPDRDTLDEEQELQTRYIGGSFLHWVREQLPALLAHRKVFRTLSLADEPQIVVTTNMPGLVALDEIFEPEETNFIYLLDSEFQRWEETGGALDWVHQVHLWNRFRTPDGPEKSELARLVDTDPATDLRVHEIGDQWYEHCGKGSVHLWRWSGDEFELLETGVEEFVL